MIKCQIMTYGGKHQWIDMAHRKNPEINWYIFVGALHKKDTPEHWEDINEKIEQLNNLQKGYPELEKIHYKYLELDFENNLIELIRYFIVLIESIVERHLLSKVVLPLEKEPEITCNITEGLFEQRLALFIASQICSNYVKEVFYINRQSFEKNILLINLQLPDQGIRLLAIIGNASESEKDSSEPLAQVKEFNLSELLALCNEKEFKLDLPSLSRLVKRLSSKGFINERRDGRSIFISISDLGRIYCPNKQYEKIIKKEFVIKNN